MNQPEGYKRLSLTPLEFLKYKQSEIENYMLPYNIKAINMFIINDSHDGILILQTMKKALATLPYISNLMDAEIDSLKSDLKEILKKSYKLSRKFNQNSQRNLHEKNIMN